MEEIKKNSYKNKSLSENFFEKSKICVFSLMGIIIFFIPIKVNNQFDTPIYHISYFFENKASSSVEVSIIFFIVVSIFKSILNVKRSDLNISVICCKIFSLIILVSIFIGKENLFFINDNFVFILKDLIMYLSILLSISSLFMPFLLDYGLIEITEAYTHKIMKKMFKVSGKIFLNFLVYFLVSDVCGIFVTCRLYKDGKLREREAAMTVLNFSVLSLSLTKELCNKINISVISFFLMEIIVLIVCNLIICRIYPLKKKKQSYYFKSNHKNVNCRKHKINKAIKTYYENKSSKNLLSLSLSYFNDVIYILMNLIPSIILIFFVVNIIYNIPFIMESVNNIINIFLSIFNLPNSNLISNIINLNLFSSILAMEGIPQNSYYITKLIMGSFISLQCVNFCLLIPFIKKSIINLTVKEILVVAFERLCIITFICFVTYKFYLAYII
ncbi:hypothetical protein [Terrisporobacter sp.]